MRLFPTYVYIVTSKIKSSMPLQNIAFEISTAVQIHRRQEIAIFNLKFDNGDIFFALLKYHPFTIHDLLKYQRRYATLKAIIEMV